MTRGVWARRLVGWAMALGLAIFTSGFAHADDDGFVSIFNGTTLEGWDADPALWSVKDGAITGVTGSEKPIQHNTFCIWRKGEVADFELKVQYRIVGGNSGVQYRSIEDKKWPQWVIGGYQADIDSKTTYSGILYEERGRGILAKRGEKTTVGADHKPKVTGSVGVSDELQASLKQEDWNEYHIIAKGNHFIHKINDRVFVEVLDEDAEKAKKSGLLAFQLHKGPPMTVQFKNIRLKRTDGPTFSARSTATFAAYYAAEPKNIVFIAGKPSHAIGDHEHNAGCLLLAKCLNESVPGVKAVVHKNGWPADPNALTNANTIIMYCDGGGGHYVNSHLEEVDALMKKGVGLVCIHYGVEVPKGPAGDKFLEWTGGYFETFWSVNPHWDADFTSLPEHPITRGVKPFKINDEWYYHMRFRDKTEGLTKILTAIPPDATRERNWGTHHGGNETVLARRGKPEDVAWALERTDGGRGFGFTGGHYHRNWGDDNFRKLVLNAIIWTAGMEVPSDGVVSKPVTADDLAQNLDPKQPKKKPEEKKPAEKK